MITVDQLTQFCPASTPYAQALIDACAKLSIDDPHEQAMFLGQLAHECGGFKFIREIWGPTKQQQGYDLRSDLGNTKPEALAFAAARGMAVGRFYAGHGGIQITGYDNHLAYSHFVYGDTRAAANPEMLTKVPDCMLSAAWFWVTRGCQKLAAFGDEAAFEAVTKRINGGLTNLADRQAWWAKAQVALGLEG